MIKVTLPDKSVKEYQKGTTPAEIAKTIGSRLERDAIAAVVDGKTVDLNFKINSDASLKILTFSDKEGKEVFRHSASHILAMAVKRLFPDAKLTIGPAVDDGFYYDFDVEKPFTPADIEKIEGEMHKIIKEDHFFERIDNLPKDKAKEMQKHEPYKLELIDDLGDDSCVIYKNGEFNDLCRGPHVSRSGKIGSVKLTKIAGAYWRGDAKNKQLQRIYGVAFPTKKELDDYLKLLEEAEKRDHRKLGKQYKLFSFHDEGPGFPFFHPKGMVLFNSLLEFWREEHRRSGYVEIKTPMMLNRILWKQSGHWDNYRENMYTTVIDEMDFAIKPMNCPGGMLLYKEDVHSYRDLPMRVGEIGLVHRHELSGTLSGLFRVRCFHQDDAHIYMTTEQIKEEILGVIKLIDRFYSVFGLSYHMELSTRPEKSIGTDEQWDAATKGLKDAMDSSGLKYRINEGDGAFYGPKIDFHIRDCLGRTWQCATVQLDMNQPERFDLTYEGADGQKHRPVMIHRVIYGAIERFLGIITEHFAGKFPLWLSPVQVRVLTVADRHKEYAEKVVKMMFDEKIRVELDDRSESISKKVREGQLDQVNYILVVGDKEAGSETVNVRTRDNVVVGERKVDQLIVDIKKLIEEKTIN